MTSWTAPVQEAVHLNMSFSSAYQRFDESCCPYMSTEDRTCFRKQGNSKDLHGRRTSPYLSGKACIIQKTSRSAVGADTNMKGNASW